MRLARPLHIVMLTALVAASCGDGANPPETAETSESAPVTASPAETAATAPGPTTPSGQVSTTSAAAAPVVPPWPGPWSDEAQRWTVEVEATVPHDPGASTQGLERSPAGLFESTGIRGESTLRTVELGTGRVVTTRALDPSLYGEGLTVVGDEIIQLTWQAGVALRWDAATLTEVGRHSYDGEGWGLCFDGADLWMSDGSSTLTRRDPENFEPIATVSVTRAGDPVVELNELECIDGHVVANVFTTSELVVIEPVSGTVRATIDAQELVDRAAPLDSAHVLNGVADLGDGTLLLGGKKWSEHYVVSLHLA